MSVDARLSAWVQSWDRLETLAVNRHKNIPKSYQKQLVAEAKVLAELAGAVEDIGLGVGEYLQERHEREQESKKQSESLSELFKDRAED